MNRSLSECGITVALPALVMLACGHASSAMAAGTLDATTSPDFLSTSNPGPAAVPVIQCESVGDDVLSRQSGKYAGNDMISGFVLSVLSQWHLPNGATAVAQGALTVAQNLTNQLTAQVQTYANVTDTGHGGTTTANSGANPAAVATGGQNVSVNGVSQVTQVAGNGNVGSNSTTIDYSGSNAVPAPVIAGATNQSTATASNANGTVQAGITFAGNSINVAVRTPAGIATQSIVAGNTQQAGTIAQLLQIAGNNQQVANQLALRLQTQPMSAATIRQTGLLNALRNIR